VTNRDLSLQQVKEELSKIRGHLVDMPLDFLIVSDSLVVLSTILTDGRRRSG